MVATALMATACHSAESKALGPGLYSIRASGRNSADLIEDSYEEAMRVCPSGFDVVDGGGDSRDTPVTFDNGQTYTTIHRADSTVIIRCRQQPMRCSRPSCD